jgi:hypothetical protein
LENAWFAEKFSVKRLRSLILVPAFFALSGISQCEAPTVEMCTRKIPDFRARVEKAIAMIEVRVEPSRVRMLASEPRKEDEDPEFWIDWAEDQLLNAQSSMDIAERDQALVELKRSLSRAADDFVTFRFYAEKNDYRKMLQLLKRVRDNSAEVSRRVCSG